MAIVAVALAASGCNQQDDGAQQDERLPILLKASVDVEAVGQTRAAGDWGERTTTMTQGSEFLAGEQVMAYIKEGDGTNPATIKWPIEYVVVNDGDGDADDGDLDPKTDTTPFYFPVGVNTINIHAIHPSYTSDAGFTVETDQTMEANYAKSDLCYSKPRDYTRSGTTAYLDANGRRVLQFKHLLSKIIVNLTVDATAATSAPSYISLHAKTTTAMTFPVDNANGYTGCTASDASYPGVIKMKQEAIIPPQDIAAGASFISMNVPGIGSMIYPMPTATSFESGKKYTYNLKVTDVGITATTNVTDWSAKNDGGAIHGMPVPKYKLNPLWYVTESCVKSYNSSTHVVTFEPNPRSGGSYTVYTWYDAMTYFAKQTTSYNDYWSGSLVNDGTTSFRYHLPILNEWYSICSATGNILSATGFLPSGGLDGNGVGCCFGFNDETKIGIRDWSYWSAPDPSGSVRYAIRFLGTWYCSVWKYEYTPYYATITSRIIDPLQKDDPTLSTKLTAYMNDASFWATIDENEGAVQRCFYLSGYINNSNSGGSGAADAQKDTHGHSWSTTQVSSNTNNAWYFYVIGNTVGPYICVNNYGKKFGFSVRLFRDN